jgi:hypothetical protein
MNTIEHQIKLLLNNKNWRSPNSFEELGYIYFGPLLFNFFIWLKTEINGSDKILFNSREGFFLEKLYKIFQQKYNLPESVYFKTSRKLSSLVACFTKDDVYNTFKLHRYSGYLSNLLMDRFGVNVKIDSDYLLDTRKNIPNLDDYIEQILDNARRIREEYDKYISDIIGTSQSIVMVDSGYQGTTQYYLEKTYDLTFKGRYITFKGNHYLNDVVGLYDFNTTQFPQNIIFFESVFIDRVGSYVDIKDGNFINESVEQKLQFFDEKEKIVIGIEQFINDMLDVTLDETTIPVEYSDCIFNLMCTDAFITNKKLTDVFYHDNFYTRDTIKKVLGK